MDSVTNLRTFLAVVQHGGFSKAAQHLHVVPSVVAKRIAQLEQTMGARLFDRTTRSVALTEAGQRLKTHAGPAVGVFEDLVDAVSRNEGMLEGHIRVMAPTTLTTLVLSDAIASFLEKYDRITLEVALADKSVNPLEQAYDIVISGRAAHYDGVIQLPLAPIEYRLCASPAYVQARGPLEHPSDLVAHHCMIFKPAGNSWNFKSSKGMITVDVHPKLVADDNNTLLQAAIRGVGIALLPAYILRHAVAEGQLVELLPEFPAQDNWFKAYIPKRLKNLKRINAFCDWIALEMKQLNSIKLKVNCIKD